MRKKITWIIIFITFILLFFIIIKPFRTESVMEGIAIEMLTEDGPLKLFSSNQEPIYQGIKGPIVTDRLERVEYRWYKVLEWGDTASISAYVYKNFLIEFSSIFRDKNTSDVTTNNKWYYIYVPEGISKFENVLPLYNQNSNINSSKINFFQSQKEFSNSLQYIVNPNRLFFFLQKGYFTIVEKNDEYTIVDFYEPIAILNKINSNKGTFQTITAKIYFNDAMELVIQPIEYY